VLEDVADGFITPEVAGRVYGVVVNSDGQVDRGATERARARLAAAEPERGLGPGQVHPVGGSVRLSTEG
jgi:hypothetical protein